MPGAFLIPESDENLLSKARNEALPKFSAPMLLIWLPLRDHWKDRKGLQVIPSLLIILGCDD